MLEPCLNRVPTTTEVAAPWSISNVIVPDGHGEGPSIRPRGALSYPLLLQRPLLRIGKGVVAELGIGRAEWSLLGVSGHLLDRLWSIRFVPEKKGSGYLGVAPANNSEGPPSPGVGPMTIL